MVNKYRIIIYTIIQSCWASCLGEFVNVVIITAPDFQAVILVHILIDILFGGHLKDLQRFGGRKVFTNLKAAKHRKPPFQYADLHRYHNVYIPSSRKGKSCTRI